MGVQTIRMGDFTDSIQQLSTTSTEFKRALKVLIKYEINCLLKRLSDTGEEAIVITTSLEDGVQGHLSTVKGEGFIQATDHVKTLKEQFLHFCNDSSLSVSRNVVESNDGPVDFSKKSEAMREKSKVQTVPVTRLQHDKGRNCNQVTEDSHLEMCPYEKSQGEIVNLDKQCLEKQDRLCHSPYRHKDSQFFQESDSSINYRGEEVQRTYEQDSDCEFIHGQSLVSDSLYDKDRETRGNRKRHMSNDQFDREHKTLFVDRYRMKERGYHNAGSPSHWHDLNSTHQRDLVDREPTTMEHLSCSDREKSSMISTGYGDYAIRKLSGYHPGFNLHRDNLSSRSDLDYLHQCYFRRLTNDYGGELIDFSVKDDNPSKTSDEETFNTVSVEKRSMSTIQESKSEGNRLKNTVLRSPNEEYERKERSFSGKTFGSWTVEEPKPSEHCQKGNVTEVTELEALNQSKEKEGADCLEREAMDIKLEPYEPVNLKMEPEEKNTAAVVKIEPGTDTASTINKILSDPNVSNYTAQGQTQGHSPTSSLTMHLNFSCKICGQNFKNRQYRDFHVKLHGSSHQYFCNLCSAGFDSENECQKHQSEHTEPVFQCESCGYRCTREFRMRAHKEICGSPSKIFKCPFCYKQFAAHRYLRIHIKSHDAHNIHTCPVCQNTYPLKNSLLKHMKKKHSQN